MKKQKLIILDVVGLSPALIEKADNIPNIKKLISEGTYRKMTPTFPSVTSSVQASMISGKPPSDHGIIANGYFDKLTFKPEFWRQENGLVRGPRIWDWMREKDPDSKVAVMFWQNSKYIDADIVISPSPMHTDEGMIEWCYSKPVGLYESLVKDIGEFHLHDYWGPMAGRVGSRGTDWIVNASEKVLLEQDPDMMLVYLPHLDYVSQREHPQSEAVLNELPILDKAIGKFMDMRDEYGKEDMTLMIVSEYGLTPVTKAVSPNKILRDKGYLKVREIQGKEYIDYELSDAFCLVDHQIANVYCKKNVINEVKTLFNNSKGISEVLDKNEQTKYEVQHERTGDLVLLADIDKWFSYFYWLEDDKMPFFAERVDIHNKPGYDPCELFADPKTRKIIPNTTLIKGSHGLPASTDEQMAVFICTEDLGSYAPEKFNAELVMAMLYRLT